jgi:HEAT repeat protein
MLCILLVYLLPQTYLFAQGSMDAGRTLDTQIADLLNRFPSQDENAHINLMEIMASLGQPGLTKMALMLSPSSNNEKLEYALAGFAFYASQETKSDYARMVVQAYGKGLDKLEYMEGKEFLLRQFQWLGKEDAAPFVEPYLHDERLSSTASMVLDNIGSSSAEQALLLALRSSDNDVLRKNFIQALGDMRSKDAAGDIVPFVKSNNINLQKVSLYALSQIADPKSAKILKKAAKDANYTYENTNATALYLRYIGRLAEEGNTKQALKLASDLHKNATEQSHTKSGALGLLAALNPSNGSKLLQTAALSENELYRGAALKNALNTDISGNFASWKSTLNQASPAAKVSIIHMLGQYGDKGGVDLISPYLGSTDMAIRQAAIKNIVLVGDNTALSDLLALVNGADKDILKSLQSALLTMKGENVTSEVAKLIPAADDNGKVVLIEILAARSAEDHMGIVLQQINSTNPEVKKAAYAALAPMANTSHLDQLLGLLRAEQNPEFLQAIQEALVTAALRMNNPTRQTQWVSQNIGSLEKSKQIHLYNILAQTGSNAAFDQLQTIYDSGDQTQKMAVIRSLNTATDSQAATMLLGIARNAHGNQREEALKGFVSLVPAGKETAENKVIALRNALELSTDNTIKSTALRALGQNPTFQALVTAGKYLDNPALNQTAARAVMNIVANNDDFFGDVVRNIVEKTRDVISGQDSQYYKTSLQKYLDEMPAGKGFYALFNEKDLEGWQGVFSNPVKRAAMDEKTYQREQDKANKLMAAGWEAKDGLLIFKGKGENIGTVKHYGDFEMFVDWKITADGDAGLYLRGTPQVQIWDTARTNVGAEVGSGGLYNNTTHPSKPLKVADNPVEEWNTFHIKMIGEKVTVFLNGELVVDNVTLENYWDRSKPLFPKEMIELQAHGTYVAYRDIYIRELDGSATFQLSAEEKEAGFEVLFDGSHLDKWTGNKTDYVVENGNIVIYPDRGGSGNLFTEKEFDDFNFRFEFKLTPGANNGLGIRAPLTGDAAYVGMELQILDNTADIYKNLKEYQFHGSLYGVAAAKRGHLKPVGEWNYQEVIAKGNQIKVILNGVTILDVDITEAKEKGTIDGREHPGLSRKGGHIGFLGHGDVVYFRNIRVMNLSK